MFKLIEVEDKKLEKPVYFVNERHPELTLTVTAPRAILDANGEPHPIPGEYVVFSRGIAIANTVRVVEKIRGCEDYRSGRIKEYDELPKAIEAHQVKVHIGPISSKRIETSVPAVPAPADVSPKVYGVRGPKKK